MHESLHSRPNAPFAPRDIYIHKANHGPQTGAPPVRGPPNPNRNNYAAFPNSGPYAAAYPQDPTPVPSTPTTYTTPSDYYGWSQEQQNYNATAAQASHANMSYQQYGNGNTGYNYPPGYSDQYAQQQQYQPTPPPQIRNPFGPPPPPRSSYYSAQNTNYDPEHEANLAQWQSAYAPPEEQERNRRGGKGDKSGNPNLAPIGVRGPPPAETAADAKPKTEEDKKKTVVRKGGGQTWEDQSLLEWDPTQFRLMVGNLAGEVTDDSLAKAFAAYGVSKARVIRDKRTTKSKGFGFVSFVDGEQGFKAAREMVGKYIGSHPVTIQRSKTDLRPVVQKHDKHKGKNNRNKEKDKSGGKQDDPLRAHTGAHIEKKAVMKPAGMKMLG